MARRKRGRDLHGILLFDKPAGGSSNQVLQRVRRLFDANKAGHTGSLDPLATGMLPICFGEATKLSSFLIDAAKGYETTLKLGVTTDSADADGDVTGELPIPKDLDLAQLEQICADFIGDQMQIPPMVSAIKVNGQRLYKLAREGIEIERKPRPVTFYSIRVLSFDGDTARLSVSCSKGTYIRSLVTDIGDKIGCGAHVLELRRTFVAPFEGLTMWSEAQLAEHENPDLLLMPVDAGLEHLPKYSLDEGGERAFLHGQPVTPVPDMAEISLNDQAFGEICRIYGSKDQLMGLGTIAEQGTIAPKRVLQMG